MPLPVNAFCCCPKAPPAGCQNDCADTSQAASSGCGADPTPTSFTVTLAGLTAGSGCIECPKFLSDRDTTKLTITGGAPSGKILVTRFNQNIWYSVPLESPLKTEVSNTCDGTIYGTADVLGVAVVYSAGQWIVIVDVGDHEGIEPIGGSAFIGILPGPPCCNGQTAENILTEQACEAEDVELGIGETVIAYGGTAKVEPCDRRDGDEDAYPPLVPPEE